MLRRGEGFLSIHCYYKNTDKWSFKDSHLRYKQICSGLNTTNKVGKIWSVERQADALLVFKAFVDRKIDFELQPHPSKGEICVFYSLGFIVIVLIIINSLHEGCTHRISSQQWLPKNYIKKKKKLGMNGEGLWTCNM